MPQYVQKFSDAKFYKPLQVHFDNIFNSRPENVKRLFDLVQVKDQSVKPAFYFALRNTLVANDLDQATRIAYGAQRFRVVTLQGQLIDTSGKEK